jgi:hypothetical protein
MAIQIITLKTGDQLISELKELYSDEGEEKKGICLLADKPYVLSVIGSSPQYLVEESGSELQVKFSKWNPYSIDDKFKLPYDCVMTISNPEPGLRDAYLRKITELQKNQNTDSEETNGDNSEPAEAGE